MAGRCIARACWPQTPSTSSVSPRTASSTRSRTVRFFRHRVKRSITPRRRSKRSSSIAPDSIAARGARSSRRRGTLHGARVSNVEQDPDGVTVTAARRRLAAASACWPAAPVTPCRGSWASAFPGCCSIQPRPNCRPRGSATWRSISAGRGASRIRMGRPGSARTAVRARRGHVRARRGALFRAHPRRRGGAALGCRTGRIVPAPAEDPAARSDRAHVRRPCGRSRRRRWSGKADDRRAGSITAC